MITPTSRSERRKSHRYQEYWTVFGPVKIREPEILCPGVIREGNRAVPVQRFYKNATPKTNAEIATTSQTVSD